MPSGFDTWKDVLEVAVVPLSLAALSLVWPSIQSWSRRRTFERLILRELRELAPYPEQAIPGGSWVEHQRKELIHRAIFESASENRDFILSLPADLCYPVSQLWSARRCSDAVQWLHHLRTLAGSRYDRTGELGRVHEAWTRVIDAYDRPVAREPGA